MLAAVKLSLPSTFHQRKFRISSIFCFNITLSLIWCNKNFFYDWSNKYFFSQNSKFVFHQWWFKVSSFLTTLVSHLLATKEIWLRRRQIVMKVCLPGGPFLCVGALISIHNFMCTYRFTFFNASFFCVYRKIKRKQAIFNILQPIFFLRMNFFF